MREITVIVLRTLGGIGLQDTQGVELRPVLAQPKRLALLALLAVESIDHACRRDTLFGALLAG